MQTIQLTIKRQNGTEELYTTDVYKIPYRVSKKLLSLLDIDLNGDFKDPKKAMELIKSFAKCIEQVEPIILWVFPELTAEDLEEGADTQEIIECACKIVLFTFKDCFANLKNVLTVK